jgi:lipoprotein NlpD
LGKKFVRCIFLTFFFALILIGCTSKTNLPPVINASLEAPAKYAHYIVQKGDTIYSIAWEFGLDYMRIAEMNHLKPPYSIYPGQSLNMTYVPKRKPPPLPVAATNHRWRWPVQGKIIQGYKPGMLGNNGVDIAAPLNSPVLAANAGQVVYCGNGIRGYGNLIIIKHDRHLMSAYAFNEHLFVKLGQQVSAGQQIATVGVNDAGKAMLHFEIRFEGNPIDPFSIMY